MTHPRPRPHPSGGAPHQARTAALHRDHHTCQHCGNPATEVDHITPTAFGGTHDLDNLQSLCTPCHQRKTRKDTTLGHKRHHAAGKHPGETHPGLTPPSQGRGVPLPPPRKPPPKA